MVEKLPKSLSKEFMKQFDKRIEKKMNKVKKDYKKYLKMSVDELAKLQFKFIEEKIYNTETLEALRIALAQKEGVKYSREMPDGEKVEIFPDGKVVKTG